MAAEIRILSTDGKLYKSELWDNSKTAQGIAVFELEQNHQFVIEVNSYNNYCSFSNDAENPSSFKFSSDSDCFLLNGYDNTQLLYPYFTANEDYAIAIVKNRNGYIGTAKEYKIIFENYNKISEALSVIGCTLYYPELFYESMWTSNISNTATDPEGNYLIVYCYNCSSDSLDAHYSDTMRRFILLYKYTGSLEENDVKPRTITENLQILKDSTDAIKQAIIDKGGTIEGDITTWASAISEIETGSSGGNTGINSVDFYCIIDESPSVSGEIELSINGSFSNTDFLTQFSGGARLYLFGYDGISQVLAKTTMVREDYYQDFTFTFSTYMDGGFGYSKIIAVLGPAFGNSPIIPVNLVRVTSGSGGSAD